MTTAQVVETSVTLNNNSPIQDYVHPDHQTQPTFEMTPGFKPFTLLLLLLLLLLSLLFLLFLLLLLHFYNFFVATLGGKFVSYKSILFMLGCRTTLTKWLVQPKPINTDTKGAI